MSYSSSFSYSSSMLNLGPVTWRGLVWAVADIENFPDEPEIP